MKAFIESQFGYCPLVWMFCGRQTNARINHIHERALRAVYNDEISPFEELLGRDKSETIHRRNIKILAAELFKIKNGLSNDIMAQLICKRNSVGYSLRSQTDFSLPQVKSVNYGLKALRYFGPKIWNIISSLITGYSNVSIIISQPLKYLFNNDFLQKLMFCKRLFHNLGRGILRNFLPKP